MNRLRFRHVALALWVLGCSSTEKVEGGPSAPGVGGSTEGPLGTGGAHTPGQGGGNTAPGGSAGHGGTDPGGECAALESSCERDEDCCLGHCLGERCELPACKIDGDCVYDWECCEYCHIDHCH